MTIKPKITTLITVLFCFSTLFAQEDLTQIAENFYAERDYESAVETYKKLLEEGESADLYYNYANALFKTNELGKAVLYYERALKINPLHADAKANLAYVNTKITDKVEQYQPFFLNAWFSALGKMLTTNQWAYLSIGLFLSAIILTLLFLFSSYRRLRKVCFFAGIFVFLLSVFSLIYAFSQKKHTENDPYAIVLLGSVSVKNSPSISGTELFVLHEGTKIEVLSSIQNWAQIRFDNDKIGWIMDDTFEKI